MDERIRKEIQWIVSLFNSANTFLQKRLRLIDL